MQEPQKQRKEGRQAPAHDMLRIKTPRHRQMQLKTFGNLVELAEAAEARRNAD